ncbi:MAG: hypothetical protein IKH11_05890, partial [Bacteroidales bacterium]|nr:hypothetical protein [Bacteroidales bacterium]
VPRGYLRATEIADNSGMISTGESATSKFYQISGLVNIDEGWTIKQSNDLGLGAMLGLKFGGLCGSSLVLDVDMLVKVNTNGTMSYVLGTGAFDLRSTGSFNTFFGLGYGYAVHLTRFFELMPYLLVADDYMSRSTSGSDSDMTFLMKSALVFEPGVRLAANVAYPLQVYAKVCADWLALQGEYYKYYNNQAGHKTGIGVQFGAKWTF